MACRLVCTCLTPDGNEIEVYHEMPKSEWKVGEDGDLFRAEYPRKLEEEPVAV